MKSRLFAPLILVLLIFLMLSVYIVKEGENVLLLRLGKIVLDTHGKNTIESAGLHFKWPFINRALRFDVRLQTMDRPHLQIVTAEKKDVIVDYYAKWRIADIPLFYRRTNGDYSQANRLLEQRLNDSLKAEFGRRTISEVVSEDRVNIMKSVRLAATKEIHDLGIQVVDVRIKRIDLPDQVSGAVFDRMRAERSRIAKEHLAKGRAKAEEIRAGADAEAVIIEAKAGAESQKIRAKGDRTAATVYAESYDKNPEFYALYQSLEAYQHIFSKQKDVLVLRPDSQFFKFFNHVSESSHLPK